MHVEFISTATTLYIIIITFIDQTLNLAWIVCNKVKKFHIHARHDTFIVLTILFSIQFASSYGLRVLVLMYFISRTYLHAYLMTINGVILCNKKKYFSVPFFPIYIMISVENYLPIFKNFFFVNEIHTTI